MYSHTSPKTDSFAIWRSLGFTWVQSKQTKNHDAGKVKRNAEPAFQSDWMIQCAYLIKQFQA
eukprot:1156523-Pelagomonas_calceolata.AAC.2